MNFAMMGLGFVTSVSGLGILCLPSLWVLSKLNRCNSIWSLLRQMSSMISSVFSVSSSPASLIPVKIRQFLLLYCSKSSIRYLASSTFFIRSFLVSFISASSFLKLVISSDMVWHWNCWSLTSFSTWPTLWFISILNNCSSFLIFNTSSLTLDICSNNILAQTRASLKAFSASSLDRMLSILTRNLFVDISYCGDLILFGLPMPLSSGWFCWSLIFDNSGKLWERPL